MFKSRELRRGKKKRSTHVLSPRRKSKQFEKKGKEKNAPEKMTSPKDAKAWKNSKDAHPPGGKVSRCAGGADLKELLKKHWGEKEMALFPVH